VASSLGELRFVTGRAPFRHWESSVSSLGELRCGHSCHSVTRRRRVDLQGGRRASSQHGIVGVPPPVIPPPGPEVARGRLGAYLARVGCQLAGRGCGVLCGWDVRGRAQGSGAARTAHSRRSVRCACAMRTRTHSARAPLLRRLAACGRDRDQGHIRAVDVDVCFGVLARPMPKLRAPAQTAHRICMSWLFVIVMCGGTGRVCAYCAPQI